MGTVFTVIGVALSLLVAVVLLRTLSLKPTSAKTATVPQSDPVRAGEYGEKLGALLACETISEPVQPDRSKFYAYHEKLKELFPKVFETCEIHDFNGSLLLKWAGKGNGLPIMMISHMDVVEATGEWEHDPFGGEVIDGNVWGRGAVDTKGSQFCFFQAAEELIASGYVPEVDVYLGGSCTEEVSGEGAPETARWLKEQGVKLGLLLDEGGMILNDPIGGVHGMYAMVGVLEKGYGDVKFVAHGKGGHASAPGSNTPWARLAAFIHDAEKHNPFKSEFSPTVIEMFRQLAPNMGFGMRMIFANLWLFKPLLKKLMKAISPAGAAMLQTTLAFTMGKGSDGYNVIPQTAYVTGNMRFIPHQPMEESIEIVRKLAVKYDIETEVITASSHCEPVSYESPQYRLVEEVVKSVYPGVGVSPYTMTGGTDSKFYSEVCDNCLRFAPLHINKQQYGSIHGLNENISANVLPLGVDFYKQIIMKQG